MRPGYEDRQSGAGGRPGRCQDGPVMRSRLAFLLALLVVMIAGCGSSGSSGSSHSSATTTSTPAAPQPASVKARASVPPPGSPAAMLAPSASFRLPGARSGVAVARFASDVYVLGGLASGASSAAVFRVSPSGATTAGPLPSPVHDAAAAALGGRLLLFGGGVSEGSDRVVQVLPGPARLLVHLPQALSDLDAATVRDTVYVVGGWNGKDTNRAIYAFRGDGPPRQVASLPLGVRYPAAASLGAKVIIAGGETAGGQPTTGAWAFDPATGQVSSLPELPAPTDHAAGAVLRGRFYLIGGLRRGAFTDAILTWAPGERSWTPAGRLPAPASDLGATPLSGGIAAIGGRGGAGALDTVTVLKGG